MRKVVNVTNISLDGVMERMEDWHFEFAGHPAMLDFAWQALEPCDALVMGRRTYESFAAAWPARDGVFADRMNTMRKYVASRTLEAPTWANTELLGGDLATALAELKAAPGATIMTYGFGPVAHTLLQQGLLDELHLLVNPMLAGKGSLDDMLIREGAQGKMELTGVRALGPVAQLSYRPA